jgi:hypothetical protein
VSRGIRIGEGSDGTARGFSVAVAVLLKRDTSRGDPATAERTPHTPVSLLQGVRSDAREKDATFHDECREHPPGFGKTRPTIGRSTVSFMHIGLRVFA